MKDIGPAVRLKHMVFFSLFVCVLTAGKPRSLDPSAKMIGSLSLPRQFGDCKDCTIKATPESLTGSEDWVEVTIAGVSYGSAEDWVGAFAPGDVDPGGSIRRFPIRYQRATTSCWPRDEAPLSPGAAAVPSRMR